MFLAWESPLDRASLEWPHAEPVLEVRPTTDADLESIARIHGDAFGPEEGPVIVDLVRELLRDETALPRLSILAESEGRPTGHVLFTAVRLDGPGERPVARILSPVAVLPELQGQGVGARLIERGLAILEDRGVDLVFVLGDPAYYARFGFQPAGSLGFEAPYPIPGENAAAWRVRALSPGAAERFAGRVECAPALDRPEHWIE